MIAIASLLATGMPSAAAQQSGDDLVVSLQNAATGGYLAEVSGSVVQTATAEVTAQWIVVDAGAGRYYLRNLDTGNWLRGLGAGASFDVATRANASQATAWNAPLNNDGSYSLGDPSSGGWVRVQSSDVNLGAESRVQTARWFADAISASANPPTRFFETLPPGADLPSERECAAVVSTEPLAEIVPENTVPNAVAGGPDILVDGAEALPVSFSERVTGEFTGSTEDLIRWAACKWGFDEDVTRARVVVESGGRMSTKGDPSDDPDICAIFQESAPCFQSHGLLQVKASIHLGSYPASAESTAWGLDYAMAWQRACYDGAFVWLDDPTYAAGNLAGCVGAWFSGDWFDPAANAYIGEVVAAYNARPWDQ